MQFSISSTRIEYLPNLHVSEIIMAIDNIIVIPIDRHGPRLTCIINRVIPKHVHPLFFYYSIMQLFEIRFLEFMNLLRPYFQVLKIICTTK